MVELAICQIRSSDNADKNSRRIEKTVGTADADLYLFPELFLTGYGSTLCGPQDLETAFRTVSRTAGEHGCAILTGTPSYKNGSVYNSIIFVTPEMTQTYDKIHLARFGPYDEGRFAAGDRPVTVEWKGMKFGLLICYDIFFPEVHRYYACHGADAVLMASASAESSETAMRTVLPARSLENTVYTAFCNNIGQIGERRFFGGSSLYSPLGKPLCTAGGSEEILTAELKKSEIDSARTKRPHLRDRRKDIDWGL